MMAEKPANLLMATVRHLDAAVPTVKKNCCWPLSLLKAKESMVVLHKSVFFIALSWIPQSQACTAKNFLALCNEILYWTTSNLFVSVTYNVISLQELNSSTYMIILLELRMKL